MVLLHEVEEEEDKKSEVQMQLVVHDGVLAQQAVINLLTIC